MPKKQIHKRIILDLLMFVGMVCNVSKMFSYVNVWIFSWFWNYSQFVEIYQKRTMGETLVLKIMYIYVQLGNCNLNDQKLKIISKCKFPNIRQINLQNNGFSDQCLEILQQT